jgi:hypothetical protein
MRRDAINRIAHLLAAAGIALVAVVGLVVFGPTDAAAINVVTFECSGGIGTIDVDVRGLGNTNICVDGTFEVDADCACVNNGGNCPADAKKQSITSTVDAGVSVEPKNGRVGGPGNNPQTIDVSSQISGASCSALQSSCGGGQTARAIIETVDATWRLCTTTAAAGEPCSCPASGSLATVLNGACDAGGVTFPGKKGSCLALFP